MRLHTGCNGGEYDRELLLSKVTAQKRDRASEQLLESGSFRLCCETLHFAGWSPDSALSFEQRRAPAGTGFAPTHPQKPGTISRTCGDNAACGINAAMPNAGSCRIEISISKMLVGPGSSQANRFGIIGADYRLLKNPRSLSSGW